MNWIIYLLLIAAAFFWGANFNIGKFAVTVMDPMSVVAWRFIIAALIMCVVLFAKKHLSLQIIRENLVNYVILGVIGIFGTNALLFVGLRLTSPINAALIMATNPMVTVILSKFILREQIRMRQGFGIILSLIGVLFVISGGSIEKFHAVSTGDLLVFCGNICWALYGVLGRKLLKNSPPLTTSTMTMLLGAICFIPFASFSYNASSIGTLYEAWLSILFMAVFGSVLAYLWWNRGIAQIGASRTSVFFNLVPVSTMILTAISGGIINSAQLISTLLVISGVILATVKGNSGITVAR